jgi:hypothetical protein
MPWFRATAARKTTRQHKRCSFYAPNIGNKTISSGFMKRQRNHRMHRGGERRGFNGNGRQHQGQGQDQNSRRVYAGALKQKERYMNMAKDAAMNGDIVLAENYYQYADHFHRLVVQHAPPERVEREQSEDGWEDGEETAGEDTTQVDLGSQPQPTIPMPAREDDEHRSYRERPEREHQARNEQQGRPMRDRPRRSDDSNHPRRSDDNNRESTPHQRYDENRPPRENRRMPHGIQRETMDEAESIAALPFLKAPVAAPQPVITATASERPKILLAPVNSVEESEDLVAPAPRRRGRPRKVVAE